MKTAWIRYFVPVDTKSTLQFIKIIADIQKGGYEKTNLFLSSRGGDITSGICAYMYVKGLGMDIDTYSMGNVDSIATILYCLGKNRYCFKYSSFIIHDVSWDFVGSFNKNPEKTMETALSMFTNREIIAEILDTVLKIGKENVKQTMRDGLVLTCDTAKEKGLVTNYTEMIIPKDAEWFVVDQYEAPIQTVKNAQYEYDKFC